MNESNSQHIQGAMNNQQQDLHHEDMVTMRLYVLGELAETDHERIEQHLLACEACLLLFMNAIEAEQSVIASYSQLPDMEKLGRQVRDVLLSEQKSDEAMSSELPIVQERSYRRRTWLQHPATHFTAAAAITLLLLGTGSFNGVADRLTELDRKVMQEEQVMQEQDPTWSDRMVTRTLTWLEGIQANRFDK